MTRKKLISSMGGIALFTGVSHAQSLFLTQEHESDAPGVETLAVDAEQVSLLWVAPPEPTVFAKHDIITVIVDEVSSQTSSQKLETETESDTSAELRAAVDLLHLLELRLIESDTQNVDLIDFGAEREFTGEGDYERSDRFSARITATIIEIKPNGTMLLEARKRIVKDDEVQTLVISGIIRQDDVTRQNTVLSSQMANLTVVLQHEGEVRDAAKKGIITQVLDALFAF